MHKSRIKTKSDKASMYRKIIVNAKMLGVWMVGMLMFMRPVSRFETRKYTRPLRLVAFNKHKVETRDFVSKNTFSN